MLWSYLKHDCLKWQSDKLIDITKTSKILLRFCISNITGSSWTIFCKHQTNFWRSVASVWLVLRALRSYGSHDEWYHQTTRNFLLTWCDRYKMANIIRKTIDWTGICIFMVYIYQWSLFLSTQSKIQRHWLRWWFGAEDIISSKSGVVLTHTRVVLPQRIQSTELLA